MTNVLVITGDPIGVKMAGPAIRSWNMARALSAENSVTLVTTTNLEPLDAPFALERVRPGEDARFAELERWADVILFQGHARDQFAALQHDHEDRGLRHLRSDAAGDARAGPRASRGRPGS